MAETRDNSYVYDKLLKKKKKNTVTTSLCNSILRLFVKTCYMLRSVNMFNKRI